MKIFMTYRLVWYIAIYHLLLSLAALFLLEVDGSWAKSDLKTKLLLQNIRAHLAQKKDEIIQKEECESGLILCKNPKSKETEEEEGKSEEIPPPLQLARGQHKPISKVSSKDVINTLMPKARNSLFKKPKNFREYDNQRKKFFFKEKIQLRNESNETNDKNKKVDQNRVKNPLKLLKQTLKVREQRQDTKVKFLKSRMDDELGSQPKKKIKKEKTKAMALKNERTEKKTAHSVQKTETIKDEWMFHPEALMFWLDPADPENNLCKKHSQIYLKQLRKYQIWALMMYDASGKFPSGVLQGNINQYGDFDECLGINAIFKNIKHKFKDSPGIKGKYCLATVDLTTESENKNLHLALERAKSFHFIKSTIQDPGHFIPRFSTINWGVCVPSSCPAQDVEKFIKSRLEVFSNATGLSFDINVDESNCVVKHDLKFKFETGTVITILFYVIVLTISLYASFLDFKTNKAENNARGKKMEKDEEIQSETKAGKDKLRLSVQGKAKKIVMAFSIKKNLNILFSDTNKEGIECINGIKSILTIMLYVAHKTIPLGMTPFSNRVFLTKISNQPITIFLRASIIYTDSFLLLSGVLTSYNLAKEISNKNNLSWGKKYLARFIRLTPALLAVLLFYAYIWDQLNSGPIWNLIVRKSALLCRKHMWKNLLYIQNFFAFEDMCAPQTHQLALDMQLSLLAPLLVHLIHAYDKAGVGILQALLIISSVMRYISASKNELSVVIYHEMPVSKLYKTANLLYSQTFHRASPYVLGVIVGYHLEKFGNKLYIPKAFAALGWILSFSFGFYSIVTPSPLALRGYQYDAEEAAQYAALSPVAWSLALSWLVIACHLGYGGFLNDFLCRKVFLIFSRISYSVYLTQFLVFFYIVGVKRIPEMFSVADSLNFNEFFTIIGVSVIVTLLFDIPMTEIKNIILGKKITSVNSFKNSTKTASSERQDDKKKNRQKTEIIHSEDSQEIILKQVELIDEEQYEFEVKEDEIEDENEETEDEGNYEDDEVKDKRAEKEEDNDKYSEEETMDEDDIVVEEVLEIRPVIPSQK